MRNQIGFSRRNQQDAYYDGWIGIGQGYDEDSGEVFSVPDYWGFKITKDELGYIEDVVDELYLFHNNYDSEKM